MNKRVFSLVMVLILAFSAVFTFSAQANSGSSTPTLEYKEGNPTCEGLNANWFEIKFEEKSKDDPSWPESIKWGDVKIELEKDIDAGKVTSWSSNYGIDAVIVKGGPGANVYKYDPEATSGGDLYTPTNTSGRDPKPYGLSHVSFCLDLELVVKKLAEPYFTRTWDWDIEKSADQTSLTLSEGQVFPVNYTIVVDSSYKDSDWGVKGNVFVKNPAGIPVTFNLTDTLTDYGAVTLTCEGNYTYNNGTYTLPGGYTMECTYDVTLSDGTTRTNIATATPIKSKVGAGSDSETFSFTNPTTEIDKCVTVTDTLKGTLGTVCGMDKTFSYSLDFSTLKDADVVLQCGENIVTNTAQIEVGDRVIAYSTATVTATVKCVDGCTLTPGYWKTHSSYGPAPYDDTWAKIGEGTSFFLSGQSYYQVLWTPSAGGNAYYILARAYIAASLNILNGASAPTEVTAALDWAETFFGTYTPTSTLSRSVRSQALSYASLLDSYNNGYIGPGHCSE